MSVNTTMIENWFIPLDIFDLTCIVIVLILTIVLLLILLTNKRCWTVPMLLVANSCFAELILGSCLLGFALFTLHNDWKRIQSEDFLCAYRAYIGYASCALLNYSYLLQSIYRYTLVIYPTRLFWQTARTQFVLILFTWLLALLSPMPFLFTGDIIYDPENQICQVPLGLSFPLLFLAACIYVIPVMLLQLVYFRLVRYVKGMTKRVTFATVLSRAQRELKMVRRIIVLTMILFIVGFPYALFILISLFTTAPRYHFRIAYFFIDLSLVCVKIISFQFTEPVKTSLKRLVNKRTNAVVARLT